MTIYSHMKTINISTLKSTLSSALRQVRNGSSIVVIDRDIPVARIIPYQEKPALTVRKPKKSFTIPDSNLNIPVDPLSFLMEDRGKR